MMHACSMYFVCISFSLPTTTQKVIIISLSFFLFFIYLSLRVSQRLLMDSGVDHDEQFKKKQQQIIMMDGIPPFSKTTHISRGLEEDTTTMPSPSSSSSSSFHQYPPSPVSQDDGGSTTNDNRSTACR